MTSYSGDYLIYLRKSRADIEAEQRGEGETLARHEHALLELAGRLHLNITDIYREVVSGETIAARPMMQRLLSEVEQGVWAGVLVMEVERLARGDTIDQGIVAQTFKYSNTKIITPSKTYDPENEFDEEYFEFGLFMSRREYKTINRRLQRGRVASVQEGKYVGSRTPYGYSKEKVPSGKGYMLVPDPEQAQVVRMIFQLFVDGEPDASGKTERLGLHAIARRLNEMKIPARFGDNWTPAVIREMLRNPIYIGKLRWGWRKEVKRREDGKVVKTRPRATDYMISDGLHQPIIDEALFRSANEYLDSNRRPSVHRNSTLMNPLTGIVFCGMCGRRLQRRPNKGYPDELICVTPDCKCVGANLEHVEAAILDSLSEWLNGYRIELGKAGEPTDPTISVKEQALRKADADIEALEKQRDHLHDLLEQGVYDTETFLERSRIIAERLKQTLSDRETVRSSLSESMKRMEMQKSIVPKVENVIDAYWSIPSAKAKNDLLREVLEKVIYTKEKHGTVYTPQPFTIDIYPKIPRVEDLR